MGKRLLFVVGQLGLGGHVRTAITYAQELRQRGWDVTFCGTDSGGAALVESHHFRLIRVQSIVSGEFFPDSAALRAAVDVDPVVAHSFDLGSLPFAARVAERTGSALVHTICGGKVPWYPVPDIPGLVVMSEELATGIERKLGRRPDVISGRIDPATRRSPRSRSSLRKRFGYAESQSIAMMTARVGATKIRSIRGFLDLVVALARTQPDRNWEAIICGSVESSAHKHELDRLAANARSVLGRRVLTHDDSFSEQAYELLPVADLFCGVGDAFAEAAINDVLPVLVGDAGYGGLITEESWGDMFHFNLSGRHVVTQVSGAAAAAEIATVLEDASLRLSSLATAQHYVEENLAVGGAVARYEAMYQALPRYTSRPEADMRRLEWLLKIRRWYLTRVPSSAQRFILKARGMA